MAVVYSVECGRSGFCHDQGRVLLFLVSRESTTCIPFTKAEHWAIVKQGEVRQSLHLRPSILLKHTGFRRPSGSPPCFTAAFGLRAALTPPLAKAGKRRPLRPPVVPIQSRSLRKEWKRSANFQGRGSPPRRSLPRPPSRTPRPRPGARNRGARAERRRNGARRALRCSKRAHASARRRRRPPWRPIPQGETQEYPARASARLLCRLAMSDTKSSVDARTPPSEDLGSPITRWVVGRVLLFGRWLTAGK